MMRLSRLVLAAPLALVLLFAGPALAHEGDHDAPVWSQAFDPARDPATDLKQALAAAKAQNKRVLIDVGGDWCIWCKLLDAKFEQEADLRQLRDANFVVLKVHYDKKLNQNEAFLSQYPKAAGYPHLYVLDSSGKLLQSQDTSLLELPKEQGKGHDSAKIKAFLTDWAPRSGT
jgi:thiol:disulfide interchange protein